MPDHRRRSSADLPLTFASLEPYSRSGLPPTHAPDWIWDVDHPYLHGLFAPVATELSAGTLTVERGAIPDDLDGLYVVNGPNQRFPPKSKYHYYDGDGMLHAVRFRDGTASYASRWIRTYGFVEEERRGRSVWPGLCGPFDPGLPHSPIKDTSNTDIVFHNGRLLSLWYLSGVPYGIDPHDLTTLGPQTFGSQRHLSAHSKVDPRTGELLFFSYQDEEPYLSYGVLDAAGAVRLDTAIDLPGPRSPHDLGVTARYSILHDLPYFHDVDVLRTHGKRVLTFHAHVPARFGVIPRHGPAGAIRWFEAEPCYILHVVNCWEDGDAIVMVGCRQPNPGGRRDPLEGPLASQMAERRRVHQLYEWRFDLRSGGTRERVLDDSNTEFPTVNALYLGVPGRYAYHQYIPRLGERSNIAGRCQTFDALFKYDLADGSFQRYDYGSGACGTETRFAPRAGAGLGSREDDGYLVTFVHDSDEWMSRCLVFDATDIEQGPIAVIRMPRRFGVGFHTTWVRGEDLR